MVNSMISVVEEQQIEPASEVARVIVH
jgi:hypothetical protein